MTTSRTFNPERLAVEQEAARLETEGRRPFLMAIQGLDVGTVLRHRLVDEDWQYETLVRWGTCGPAEWVPTIELTLKQYSFGAGRPV